MDLSGNKLHAVPIGDDLPLNNPSTDAGISNDRPIWVHTVKAGKVPDFSPNALGDSFEGENHGRSLHGNKDHKCMWI